MNIEAIDNIYDLTVAASAIMVLYDVSPEEKQAIKQFAKIANNYAVLVNDSSYCPKNLYCNDHGECEIDSSTKIRTCKCDAGFKGTRCELDSTNYDAGHPIVQTLLSKVNSYQIQAETVSGIVGSL